MAKWTPRDNVWSYSLTKALIGDTITVEYVRNNLANPLSERTIRDVLNTMVEQGWLEKEKKQSHSWCAGPELEYVELVDENHPPLGSWK